MATSKKRARVERKPARRATPTHTVVTPAELRSIVSDIASPLIRQALTHPFREYADEVRLDANVAERGTTTPASPQNDTPRIEVATGAAESLCKRLQDIANQLDAYNETRLGPEAQPAGAPSGATPPSSGQAGQLIDALSTAHNIAGRLERELYRLSKL